MIRKWSEGDIPVIAEIERQCFSDPWNGTMLAESLNNPAFRGLLIESEGIITGYVGYLICGDAEIALIAVSPEYRRHGFGSTLLSSAIEDAKNSGAENVFLEVRVGNVSARELYGKHGFIQIAERKKYYEDGEDALVMVKCLR